MDRERELHDIEASRDDYDRLGGEFYGTTDLHEREWARVKREVVAAGFRLCPNCKGRCMKGGEWQYTCNRCNDLGWLYPDGTPGQWGVVPWAS
ncbi:MAG: hypothetical protein WC554_09835 [Clostridia bacterium]|jgi:hypothetical protein